MADSSLRLKIVTALDNAGLKATENQLNSLERSLQKVNTAGARSMGGVNSQLDKARQNTEQYEKSLTKIPGHFGKMAEGLGTVGKAIGVVYAQWKTFETGVSFGRKIFEHFGDGAGYSLESIKNGFAGLKDTIEKFFTGVSASDVAKTEMDNAKKMMDEQLKAYDDATQKKLDLMKKEQNEHSKVIEAINRETRAYMSQAQTLSGLKSAQGNAELIWLEQQKFRNQQSYELQGDHDAAEQIGLAYDMEIQRTKNKHEIMASQQRERQAQKDARQAETTAAQQTARVDQLEWQLEEAERVMQELRSGWDGNKKIKGVKQTRKMQNQQKVIDAIRNDYQSRVAEEWSSYEELYSKYGKIAESQQLTANLKMAGETALDRSRLNYAMFEYERGNPANIAIDQKYIDSMNQEYASEEYFREIANNTASVAEKIDSLLQMKED